jgi:hypothetical protein
VGKDKNPDLRKPFDELTKEQQARESQEHEDGAPARNDDGTPIDE